MKQSGLLFLALAVAAANGAWAGDGVVALQSADPSCADNSGNIYVDCGNGTVTDNRTGLVWMKDASCLRGATDWHTALELVATLADLPGGPSPDDCALEDGSSPGEWRLPTVAEWYAMVADANALGVCTISITNDAGNDCWDAICVSTGACSVYGIYEPGPIYWTATTDLGDKIQAYGFSLATGGQFLAFKTATTVQTWPVRGGQ